ncbi:MAG: SDR family oxidoreductase [Vulcanimicrobiaceae bacterium]
MRIIITGGAGFIGSHVADAYLAAGHDVCVVDSLWAHGGGRRDNIPARASFLHLDIRDASLERVFRDFNPDIVSHHAAQHSVAISSRDPQLDAQVNVMGLINVLENSVKARVKKFIFASSGATFGEPEKLPIDESTPQRPESPYAITKMAAEHYLRFYKAQHGLDFTALRYGNVYGPRQDPNGEAGVISIFIGRFLARQGIKIYWDGEQTRDYVYVGDVAAANVQALTRGGGMCYCIGTGERTSVNQIYRALVEVTGFEAPVERLERRPGDVRDAQFDSSLAQRELAWNVQTPLVEGMRKTVGYFRDRLPA